MQNATAAPSESATQVSRPAVTLRPANPIPRPAEVPPVVRPAKQRLGWFFSGAMILAGGWFLASQFGIVGHDDREELPAELASERHADVVSITAAPVTFRKVQRSVEALGTLHAYEQVTISPKVEGRILKIHHEVSDRVKPGDVLFELDSTDYESSVRQAAKLLAVELARLGLEQLPAADFDVTALPPVAQSAAKLENAAARLKRVRGLASRNVATAEDLADRSSEHRVALAEHANQILLAKAGLATIHSRQEALDMAREQLAETVVRVPTPTQPVPGGSGAGVYAVSHRNISEGTFVRPGAEAFRLVIDQTLKLRAAVPELSGGEVKLGQPAGVLSASHAKEFPGTVTRIHPVIDPATRAFEVEIQMDNTAGELKPGGFAKTRIYVRDDEAAAVPLEAVVKFAGVTKIFILKEGRAEEVQVTLGEQGNTWVEIESPSLPRDTQVVTSGQSALASGTPVEVRSGKQGS